MPYEQPPAIIRSAEEMCITTSRDGFSLSKEKQPNYNLQQIC